MKLKDSNTNTPIHICMCYIVRIYRWLASHTDCKKRALRSSTSSQLLRNAISSVKLRCVQLNFPSEYNSSTLYLLKFFEVLLNFIFCCFSARNSAQPGVALRALAVATPAQRQLTLVTHKYSRLCSTHLSCQSKSLEYFNKC